MMNKFNRFLSIMLFLGIFLFLILFFGSYILESLLKPLALSFWLLLRVFVLSIDQIMIWRVLLVVFFIFMLLRLNHVQIPFKEHENKIPDPNIILRKIENWHNSLQTIRKYPADMKMLKRELAYMLVSLYASRKRIQADWVVYEAFKNRQISLPQNVYAFLFSSEPGKHKPGFRQWLNRISGREAAKFYTELKNYLDYLEKLLEMKHGQEPESI